MKFLLIANSQYQESTAKPIGWVTKNPMTNCHRNKSMVQAFIGFYRECNELMKNPKDFLSDIGAEKWENRSLHLSPIVKELFGECFEMSDFDDLVLMVIPDGWEYKILIARNGNEECMVWDPRDPGRTLKFAQEVDLDTL